MNIAICDDEKEYRNLLRKHINFYFGDRCIDFNCREYSDGDELLSSDKKFDIVFLDIEMNRLGGIETAKQIKKCNKNTVIFIVTAYQKYLDDAMDLDVFRYIDKPINSQRLYAGLDKAIDFINNNDIAFCSRDEGIITIKKSDIVCIEVARKQVCVFTLDKKYIVREKMNFFKENLKASYFAIPHNSYIINFNFVIGFKRDTIKLKNGMSVAVAPRKQADIKKKFMQFIGEGYGNLSYTV